MPSNPPNEKEIFDVARAIESPEARDAYIRQVCGDDEALSDRINALLVGFAKQESFLEEPAAGVLATEIRPVTEQPGDVIGPYKLLQQIGEGGMGVVYMAEQKEPVKRRVALKIVKPGMDTRQVIARFEAERQALAMMDHPNIAKVLDAGQTESGRPFFVMEVVNGLPVTKYCDEQHLTPKERLELFVPICRAVQHAHQKGIIHRDLKPSNILVAMYDNKAVPKIIDFGVAKATSHALTEKTMFTQLGQVVGTLEYMSPEQAQRNQLDIDTRSDIYSLGVVLFELLTGEVPFDRQRLRSAAFDEMLRIIREEEPSRPSTKVSSSQSLPSIAANRRIEPAKLGSMIRGELDWIVLKALEKDRGRRYETASSFAADIQHYLNDEAVVACPPSAGYRFRKFARRNKAAVAIVSFVAVFVITVGSGVGWVVRDRAAQRETAAQEKHALQEKADRERTALEETARREKENRRNQLVDRVEYVLEEVSKDKESQNWIGVQEAINRAKTLLSDSDEFPKLTSQILRHQDDYEFVRDLQDVRFNRGIPPSGAHARSIARQDSDRYETLFREFAVDLADLNEDQASGIIKQHSDIIPVVSEALDDWAFLQSQKGDEAAEAARLWTIAMAIDGDAWRNKLRDALIRGDSEAIKQLASSDDVLEQSPPTLWLLGKSLDQYNQRELAIAILRKGAIRYPRDFWLNYLAGQLQRRNGDYQEAIPHLAAAHAIRPAQYGAYHGFIDTLSSAGLHDQAIERWQHLIDNDRAGSWPHRGIAYTYSRSGQHQLSIAHAEEVLRRLLKRGSNTEPLEVCDGALQVLLQIHSASGEASLDLLDELVEGAYPDSAALQMALGCLHGHEGDWETALTNFRKAGTHQPESWIPHFYLGTTLGRLGRYDESIHHSRQALKLMPESSMANRAAAISNIGLSMQNNNDFAAAANQYRQAIEISPRLPENHRRLGEALGGSNQVREAIAAYREAIRLYEQTLHKEDEKGIESLRANENVSGFVKALTKLAKSLTLAAAGDLRNPQEALTLARRASDLYSEELPDAKRIAAELAVTLSRLSMDLAIAEDAKLRNPEEAVTLARRAVEIAPEESHNRPWHWQTLGLALLEAGRLEEAEQAYRTAIENYHTAFNELADFRRTNELSHCYWPLCFVLIRKGNTSEAVELVRGADRLLPKQKAALCNNVAWFLATAKDETLREASQAVALARRAVDLDPDQPEYLNTLGAALYRAGQWKKSVEALNNSISRTEGGTAFDWFFLAMNHWQLGEKELADTWYDKAVDWMEKHQPENEELLRFRIETERLLSDEDTEQDATSVERMN